MAPITKHYDYLVLGGGSGGLASGRRASSLYGAKVGIIESGRLGGTCVNVGYVLVLLGGYFLLNADFPRNRCVPKKIMWNAATMAETLAESRDYCFDTEVRGFDWPKFKTKRDAYIKRLNGIYERNLGNDKVDYIKGRGHFLSNNEIEVTGEDGTKTTYGADKILIATGAYRYFPRN